MVSFSFSWRRRISNGIFIRFDSDARKIIHLWAKEVIFKFLNGVEKDAAVWTFRKNSNDFSRGRLKHDAGINAENFFSVPRISR